VKGSVEPAFSVADLAAVPDPLQPVARRRSGRSRARAGRPVTVGTQAILDCGIAVGNIAGPSMQIVAESRRLPATRGSAPLADWRCGARTMLDLAQGLWSQARIG